VASTRERENYFELEGVEFSRINANLYGLGGLMQGRRIVGSDDNGGVTAL
jgi:hypothetical protein